MKRDTQNLRRFEFVNRTRDTGGETKGTIMIDTTRLDQLADEIGRESLAEIVDVFMSEMDETVEKLPEVDSAQAYAAQLHFLKGSALNLGLTAIAVACDEERGAIMTGAERSQNVTQIKALYEKSRAMLLSCVSEMQSAST